MKYEIDGKLYNVIVTKKHNKNTYIRVKEDMNIYITTNYLATNTYLVNLLKENEIFLLKSINKMSKRNIKNSKFNLFGVSYDIIIDSSLTNICVKDTTLYIPSEKLLDKWLKKEIKKIYLEHLNTNYEKMRDEHIPYPKLKIRNMKTRWGVCNKRDNSVTLNSRLIEYPLDKLDYVIVHELSHFVHFDHSKYFWATVATYCPKYKQIKKNLKE